MPLFFKTSSRSLLHVEQKMCKSSQTLWICEMLIPRSTEFSTCGRQSRFSPPTQKQEIVSPSSHVSLTSPQVWSGAERIGGGNGIRGGAGLASLGESQSLLGFLDESAGCSLARFSAFGACTKVAGFGAQEVEVAFDFKQSSFAF